MSTTTVNKSKGNLNQDKKLITREGWEIDSEKLDSELEKIIEKMIETGSSNAEILEAHRDWAHNHPTILH